MFLENRRKYTVREAVVESFNLHKDIYDQAKKGKGTFQGMSAETVLTWYEGGSRTDILELAKKKIEKLTLAEVNGLLKSNMKIIRCGNPCRTCGQVLELDDEFWFVPFSQCEEYPCGIQLCFNCIKGLLGLKKVKPSVKDYMKRLDDYHEWARNIEADCKQKKDPPEATIPVTLPSCKLTNEVCSYDTCPRRLKVKVLTEEGLRDLVRKKGCVHDDGHLREEGVKNVET